MSGRKGDGYIEKEGVGERERCRVVSRIRRREWEGCREGVSRI